MRAVRGEAVNEARRTHLAAGVSYFKYEQACRGDAVARSKRKIVEKWPVRICSCRLVAEWIFTSWTSRSSFNTTEQLPLQTIIIQYKNVAHRRIQVGILVGLYVYFYLFIYFLIYYWFLYTAHMCELLGAAVGRFVSSVLRPLLGFLAVPHIVRLL